MQKLDLNKQLCVHIFGTVIVQAHTMVMEGRTPGSEMYIYALNNSVYNSGEVRE